MLRTTEDIIRSLPTSPMSSLPPPEYTHSNREHQNRFALAVESMKKHMSDEGWQIMLGLQHSGYTLYGSHIDSSETNTHKIISNESGYGVVVVQDKKEWIPKQNRRDFRDPTAEFTKVEELKKHSSLFRLTILRDAHYSPPFHQAAAEQMGCHAWIVPYNPSIVHKLASYTRPQHLIRTYHSIDPKQVPSFYEYPNRKWCLFSGAINPRVYPLRKTIHSNRNSLPNITILPHPGYHRRGTHTPEYLRTLSQYKVAICTSSIYGYALRKIIEATACGCRVLTDLPTDEVLPHIDQNLTRINPHTFPQGINKIVQNLCQSYEPETQQKLAQSCINFYNYQSIGLRLSQDIETLRTSYGE